jgi:hypothetical protein
LFWSLDNGPCHLQNLQASEGNEFENNKNFYFGISMKNNEE